MQPPVRALLGAAGMAAGLAVSASAGAVTTETYNADTDAAATDFAVEGYSALPFVAEGRIGGPGTFEMDVGSDTSGDFSTGEHDWPMGDPEPFSLAFDGTTATWSIGEGDNVITSIIGADSVSYDSFGDLEGFNSLLIRAATPGSGTEVALTDMALYGADDINGPLDASSINGNGLPDFINNYDSHAADPDRLVKWMGISNDLDLADGFYLTGEVAMDWPTGNKPSQSNLAFQIKGANHTNEVPVPGTSALLAGGLLGFWGFSRRRKA
ncbi:choice-of-anchor W domain-containing protein [Thiohalorhabdus methylotrophus]|uniref:Choice-of-anchor W domain-containing protein n=1 Tax=Thiohalorhabdus methylotrophus TaxID=3242694 RepID=A0ABV4TWU5_9GAMM